MLRFLVIILWSISALACCGGRSLQLEPVSASHDTVSFIVGSQDQPRLPGVTVYIVTASGEQVLGRTDEMGTIRVQRELLLPANAFALLFCSEYFFCSAIRLMESSLEGYDERYVALAPLTLL